MSKIIKIRKQNKQLENHPSNLPIKLQTLVSSQQAQKANLWLQMLPLAIILQSFYQMSLINVVNVEVVGNPSFFTSQFVMEVSFECLQALPRDIEWKFIYVGSANDESKDQILECFDMEIKHPGLMKFTLQAPAPCPQKIPLEQLLKLTAIILSASYQNKEFFRLGYYIHYEHPELGETYALEDIDLSKAKRFILADKPRITKIPISWNQQQQKLSNIDSTNEVLSHSSFGQQPSVE